MPRTNRPPTYRLHKARGCAVVTIDGRNRYLGSYGSPESHEAYARLIAEWNSNGKQLFPTPTESPSEEIQVGEIIVRYMAFATGYYVKNGEPTGEIENIRCALRSLKKLYGTSPASSFGPKNLELVRQSMIDDGLSRRTINGRVSRIRRTFRWASKEGFVPANTYHGLLALDGLKRGRSAAKERLPVTSVAEANVKAVLPHVNAYVRAMIQVQELTGMRPQDIRNLRTCDLDRSRDVWIYRPWTHKTEHHGHVRYVAIGPKAQAILTPFLKLDDPTAYVFSPKDAVDRIRKERSENRKSPMTPSQLKRKRKAHPKRQPRTQYDKNAYDVAVARGCVRAGIPNWTPNQLRHNCGTKVRRLYGLDAASSVLGHRHGSVTEVYAEADLQKAIDVMREIG